MNLTTVCSHDTCNHMSCHNNLYGSWSCTHRKSWFTLQDCTIIMNHYLRQLTYDCHTIQCYQWCIAITTSGLTTFQSEPISSDQSMITHVALPHSVIRLRLRQRYMTSRIPLSSSSPLAILLAVFLLFHLLYVFPYNTYNT